MLVGHHEPFADISVGWSGKVHDTSIFKNTGLFRTLQQGLFSRQEDTIRDVEMSVVILGDLVYPLIPWFMKAYTGQLNSSKEHFTYRLIGAE